MYCSDVKANLKSKNIMSELSCDSNKGAVNTLKMDEMSVEEYKDEIKKVNIELNEKLIENENYRQELHELRNKLKASIETQKDLSYANELLEENLKGEKTGAEKRISNLLEKFSSEKKKYEEKITDLQNSLFVEEKKNKELRESLYSKEKLYNTLRSEDPDKTQENSILKERIDGLIRDLETREKIEGELLARQQTLEETNNTLEKNYQEIKDILQTKKVDLESLEEILETTRDELVMCRSELESLKAVPASVSVKGNSLFAEVEDNRRMLVNDMTSLKNKYLHMKRTYDSKEEEIRALKAERAALLQKLEDETVLSVDHSAKLIETYKSRISELEGRLKIEEKKLKMKEKEREQHPENNFSYLQSLLTAKKKEVEELINKLEESSIQKILQEEMKYETEKQLRQWRYKAMSYQAQLLVAQNQARCEECMKIGSKNIGDGDLQTNEAKQSVCQSPATAVPEFQGINRLESTLEKLLQVPRVSITEGKEINESSELEPPIPMDETCPVPPRFPSPITSIFEVESNKENSAGASNAKETILKSALARSEDKSFPEKTKKSLRFTTDTVDPQKPKLTRQKTEKKKYPVVFISTKK